MAVARRLGSDTEGAEHPQLASRTKQTREGVSLRTPKGKGKLPLAAGKGKQKLNELDATKRLAYVGARSLRIKKQRSIARGSQKRDDGEALLTERERGRRRSESQRQASDRDLARSYCPGRAEVGEGLLEDALESR